MKSIMLAAMVAITSATVAPAQAHSDQRQSGHWEWQASRSYGPRAALPISHRVWVPDHQGEASHDRAATQPVNDASPSSAKPKLG